MLAVESEAPKAAPGWYPDPTQVDTQRYWDGANWTDQRAPLPTPKQGGGYPVGGWVTGIGALVVAIGLFLPYVDPDQFGRIAENTMIQHSEGIIVAVLALLAILVLFRRINGKGWRWPLPVLGIAILLTAASIVANPPELQSSGTGDNPFRFEENRFLGATDNSSAAGIGVYLVGVGGLIIAIGAVSLTREAERSEGQHGAVQKSRPADDSSRPHSS